ncbi:MAG: DUF3383 domain-containing protein, partial [Ruminococcus sp.]|nr:DUF3383 domain-containing protein [Ruminococcus sp.]
MTDVKVVIDIKQAARSIGDGYPLIIAKTATQVPYKECASLEEVEAAGFEKSTPVYSAAELIFAQDDAPEKIAVYGYTSNACDALSAIIGNDWRQLICTTANAEDESTIAEIAAYIEATDKVYFADIESLSEIADESTSAVADGSEDEETTQGTANYPLSRYNRTVLCYYPQNETKDISLAAAIVGATAGKEVGSITYKNQIISAVEPLTLSTSDETILDKAHVITIVEKSGDIVTTDGVLSNGDFIDILDCKDWLIKNIANAIQQLLNAQPKIPYTNSGIGMIESAVVDVLRQA